MHNKMDGNLRDTQKGRSMRFAWTELPIFLVVNVILTDFTRSQKYGDVVHKKI